MEAEAAFVGADCAVHLDTEATVDLYFALVVNPGYAEHDYALRLNDSLENLCFYIFWMLVHERDKNIHYLVNSLMELGLCRVLCDYFLHESVEFVGHVTLLWDFFGLPPFS